MRRCVRRRLPLGRVLDTAQRTRHLDGGTYVVFLSDHGEMAMEHRQVWKNTHYEGSSRVPLASGPGVAPGVTHSGLTSLLDVYPTLLDMFGVAHAVAGVALDGASLLPTAAAHDAPPPPPRHVGRSTTPTCSTREPRCATERVQVRGVWHVAARLETRAAYPPQLFHVENDPDELRDLAADPAHSALVAELDGLLRATVDYQRVDDSTKSIDHWLYEQWYVLAGHRGGQPSLEAVWRDAYGDNFTARAWAGEWGKAKRWMAS